MRLRTALAATLLAVSSAGAQEKKNASGDDQFVTTVSVKGTPERVYRVAFDALSGMGYEFRALLLDQAIITLPQTDSATAALGADAMVVQLELEPRGDSTLVTVAGIVLRRDRTPCRGDVCQKLTAASLLTSMQAMQSVSKLLEATPPSVPTRGDSLAAAGAYGYSRGNPIRVGGGANDGAARERSYLSRLRGPAGEEVEFVRLGSCCQHPSPDAPGGRGILDVYEVTYPGLSHPVRLYVDMYREREGPAPEGFTLGAAPGRAETSS
jgi:hypothetical protein